MTKPTTSSIIAALVNTTPSLEDVSPLEASTVKVVPKLVEHNAAPAAKACTGVAFKRPCRVYESPIGNAMPVRATADERSRLAFSDWNDDESPPNPVSFDVYSGVVG
jgi:hypothetical protein